MRTQALSHDGVPGLIGEWEVDSDIDRVYYLVSSQQPGAEFLSEKVADGWRPTEDDIFEIGLALLQVFFSSTHHSFWP